MASGGDSGPRRILASESEQLQPYPRATPRYYTEASILAGQQVCQNWTSNEEDGQDPSSPASLEHSDGTDMFSLCEALTGELELPSRRFHRTGANPTGTAPDAVSYLGLTRMPSVSWPLPPRSPDEPSLNHYEGDAPDQQESITTPKLIRGSFSPEKSNKRHGIIGLQNIDNITGDNSSNVGITLDEEDRQQGPDIDLGGQRRSHESKTTNTTIRKITEDYKLLADKWHGKYKQEVKRSDEYYDDWETSQAELAELRIEYQKLVHRIQQYEPTFTGTESSQLQYPQVTYTMLSQSGVPNSQSSLTSICEEPGNSRLPGEHIECLIVGKHRQTIGKWCCCECGRGHDIVQFKKGHETYLSKKGLLSITVLKCVCSHLSCRGCDFQGGIRKFTPTDNVSGEAFISVAGDNNATTEFGVVCSTCGLSWGAKVTKKPTVISAFRSKLSTLPNPVHPLRKLPSTLSMSNLRTTSGSQADLSHPYSTWAGSRSLYNLRSAMGTRTKDAKAEEPKTNKQVQGTRLRFFGIECACGTVTGPDSVCFQIGDSGL